jgi:hypothetical protein
MRQPVAWRAFYGGILGLIGICIVFWNNLILFSAKAILHLQPDKGDYRIEETF